MTDNDAWQNPWQWTAVNATGKSGRYRGDMDMPPQPHFSIWVCASGQGSVQFAGQRISLQPHIVLLIPPGVAAQLRTENAKRSPEIVFALFDLRVRNRLIQDARPFLKADKLTLIIPGMPELRLVTQTRAGSMGDRFLRALHYYADPGVQFLELNSQVIRALTMFRAAFVSGPRQFGASPTPAHRAAQFLYQSVDNKDVSLDDVARFIGLSRTHTVRLFREEYKTSPMRFLLEQRMGLARRLLGQNEFKIAEIAELTGFSSPEFFSRTFKAEHGMSPRAFRQSVTDDSTE